MTKKIHIHTQQEKLAQELRRAERLAPVQGGLALSALALTVLLAVRPAVLAQSPGVNLAQLAARVSALESHASDPGPKGPTGDTGAKGAAGDKGMAGNSGMNGTIGTNGTNGTSGATGAGYTPANVAILGAFSVSGTDLTISGVNVHVVDGTGGTGSASGLGNLIVGYNGPSSLYHQTRSGSHNLVVGDANNYTSYGGMVCGDDNASSAPYASVLGGTQNLANVMQSSICGGDNNLASGNCAIVAGGYGNKATGFYSVVSGGNQNTATAEGSAVSGGNFNVASGLYSAISGGLSDSVSGDYAAISGGPHLSGNSGDATAETKKYGWKGGNLDTPTIDPGHTVGTFGSDKG